MTVAKEFYICEWLLHCPC